jgi:RNA polymerase sigma-70 factor (ECF subfamily)
MPSDASRPQPLEDSLLRRAAAGDPEAFAEVYRHYHQVVYRFARAMTASPAAAEDVTQEVFVALFADLSRYDSARASFTTYLYGIVRNLSRDRLRRERRFLGLDALSPGSDATAYLDDPADALEDAEVAARVRQAFQRLPIRYRELMILCDLHGLSYAEAAEVAKISIAAVRSRLHRGRHLLRQRLARLARPEPRRPFVSRFALRMLKKPAT